MRLLIVEDVPEMAALIRKGLQEQSYAVDLAADGEEALYQAYVNNYDLIILDVMLPKMNGFEVCQQLRTQGFSAPILMLTALDHAVDTVKGLDAGADDYLTKPFDFGVLVARIRALLRRAAQVRPDIIQIEDLVLNTVNHTATRGGRQIRLTAKEYAMLEFFMLHPGELLGRAQIAEHVWDENFDPFSNIIDVYVKRIRKKIDYGCERTLIQTRRGEGYILSADSQVSRA